MMLNCKKISFSVEKKKILIDISFSIEGPGCYTILGPNGAGKTTLLNAIAGMEDDYKGEIFWNDKNINTISFKEKSLLRSYLSQHNLHQNKITVWDFLSLARYPHMNLYRNLLKEEEKEANEILSQLNLFPLKKRKLETLSGGELQKIYIAGLIFQNTPYIFLDEPLSYLDIHYQKEICRFLKSWSKKKKRLVLMVSHHLNLSLLWSDKIFFLNEGSLIFEGTPKEFVSKNIIEDIYQGAMEPIITKDTKLFIPCLEQES